MSVLDFLTDLWENEDEQAEFQADPIGYTENNLPDGMTQEEFFEELPGAVSELPPEHAELVADSYGLEATAEGGYAYPSDAGAAPAADSSSVVQGGDTVTDASETTVISVEAGAEVNLDLSGDSNVAAGEGSAAISGNDNQTQTGEGVQVGGNVGGDLIDGEGNVTGSDNVIGEGNIADTAGDVVSGNESPVITGSADGAVIGEDNQVLNAGGDVGAAGFGEGAVSNLETGDGSTVGNGNIDFGNVDGNVNVGPGEQTNVEGSTLEGSAVGGGDAIDSSLSMDASGGGSIAYGESSSSSADNSLDTSMTDSGNLDASTTGSFNSETTDNSTSNSFNEEDSSINDSFDFSDQSIEESFSEHFSADGSFNDLDSSVHDSFGSEFNASESFTDTDASTEDFSTNVDGDIVDFG